MARPRIINVRHATTPKVWACRWCGYNREYHSNLPPQDSGTGWRQHPYYHLYENPTPEQVRARMKARGMIKT